MFQKEINTILARDEGAPIDVFANDDVLAWFGSYGDSFRLFCINNKAVHSRIATGTTTNEDMELIVNYLKANPVVDTLDISKYIH